MQHKMRATAGTPNDGAIADTGTEYRWRCDGQNGGSNSGTCAKTIPVTPVNGVCGSANGSTVSSAPSGLAACSPGTVINSSESSTKYTWSCQGSGGGNTVPCSADKDTSITPAEAEAVCEMRTEGSGSSCSFEYNWYGPQQDASNNWWCVEIFTNDDCGVETCYASEAPITKSLGVVSVGSYSSNDSWCP